MFGLSPSGGELIVLLLVALMLFGRKLPEVAMNIGKGLREFQSGLKGMQDEITRTTTASTSSSASTGSNYYADSSSSRPIPEEELDEDDYDVPKFELPSGPPVEEAQEQSDSNA
jgi:sec-independent protein translocase protein TatA